MASSTLTVSDLLDKAVYVQQGKNESSYRRIGKVRRFVFHPSEKRVIGFIVKRPDVALMFRRSDQFVAIDRIQVADEGVIVSSQPDAMGARALKRLDANWEKCLLWLGMELVTEDGRKLGRVGDVRFDAETGEVESVKLDEGAAARFILGEEYIPESMVRGFRFGVGSRIADYAEGGESDSDSESGADPETEANSGAIVVSNEVDSLTPEGGIAERAGAATARATQKGKQALNKAREQGTEAATKAAAKAKEAASPKMEELGGKAEDALSKGAFATGRQIGRAKGMFAGFMDEYRKASRGNDD